MPCYTDYVAISRSQVSRSGLYAVDLPGVEIALLDGLVTSDQSDYFDFWDVIYKRAWDNLVQDVSTLLRSKFYVDQKLITRETSEFLSTINNNTGLAGIKIQFDLPKYARLHILSVGIFSEQEYQTPDVLIQFYEEDANGELLHEVAEEAIVGRNTINVDTDFEVDKLFVAYNPVIYELRKTENKYYSEYGRGFSKLECTFPCFGLNGYQGSVSQVNGGGLNVKYVVYCSSEKYVCENLNLFKMAYWYRIGLEIVHERRFGQRINKYVTLTFDNWEEQMKFYQAQYEQNLKNAIEAVNIYEDPVCFTCKNVVTSKSYLP